MSETDMAQLRRTFDERLRKAGHSQEDLRTWVQVYEASLNGGIRGRHGPALSVLKSTKRTPGGLTDEQADWVGYYEEITNPQEPIEEDFIDPERIPIRMVTGLIGGCLTVLDELLGSPGKKK
jgi:hypothetical protein